MKSIVKKCKLKYTVKLILVLTGAKFNVNNLLNKPNEFQS